MAKNVDRADAARILGMREEEVVAVDGNVVTLHDRTRFQVDVEAGTYQEVLADADEPAKDAPRGEEHPAETAETTESALEKATDSNEAKAERAMAQPHPETDGGPSTSTTPESGVVGRRGGNTRKA